MKIGTVPPGSSHEGPGPKVPKGEREPNAAKASAEGGGRENKRQKLARDQKG